LKWIKYDVHTSQSIWSPKIINVTTKVKKLVINRDNP
jgi:hypothetical protein